MKISIDPNTKGLRLVVLFLLAICFSTSYAASRYWVASTASNWNNTANWSSSDGGSGGASVPGSGDNAYFTSSRNGNCTVDATVSVNQYSVSGYSGTISQGAYDLTVGYWFSMSSGAFTGGSGNMTFNNQIFFSGGTFTGGSGTIDLNQYFNLTGGSFTATSGTMKMSRNWAHNTSGTFYHNNGTVEFDGTTNMDLYMVDNSEKFYNVIINCPSYSLRLVNTNDTMVVENDLTLTNGNISSRNSNYLWVKVLGDVSFGSSFGTGASYVGLSFGGGENQSLDFTNGTNKWNGAICIEKSGGTATLASNIDMDDGLQGDITFKSGTINLDGYTIDNTQSYLRVTGDFVITGGGTINADFYSQTGGAVTFTGTAITLKTYVDFIISGGSFTAGGSNLDIDRTFELSGGTFTAPTTTMHVGQGWDHSAGTFNHNLGTVEFDNNVNNWQGINFPNRAEFYNFTFNKGSCIYEKLMEGDTLVVQGDYNLKQGKFWSRQNEVSSSPNIVMVRGDMDVDPTYCDGDHSNTVVFICDDTQTLDLTGDTDNYFGQYVINKSGGELKLLSDVVLDGYSGTQDFIVGNGTLNLNGYTIYLTGSGSDLIVYNGGTIAYNGGSVSGGSVTNTGTNYGTYSGACADPLPVDLLEFNAECKGNHVLVTWKTAMELNNDYFEVQRSLTGADFSTVETIGGHGNSDRIISYEYTDFNIVNDVIYYRLKQVDFDGTTTLSDAIAVNCGNDAKEITLFPNPTRDNISTNFHSDYSGLVDVKIQDVSGRVLSSKSVEVQKGVNELQFETNNLKSGIYFLSFNSGFDSTQMVKFKVL